MVSPLHANPPAASFIFPAGGRRGTTVPVRVGGLYLYRSCSFELLGPGVEASKQLRSIPTVWFEGPLLPLPASQQQEDYPKDMAGQVRIAADAPLGPRRGRLWTAEGAAGGLRFVVGELPEVVEEEMDGDPIPVDVTLPVTVNGRIFPREDVDVWAFTLRKGQSVTAEVHAARIGSPLDARLEVRDPDGRRLAENDDARGADPRLRFTAPADGKYQIRIHDVNFQGGPAYVYRLTLTADPVIDRVYPLGGRRGSTVRFALFGQGVPAEGVELALSAGGPSGRAGSPRPYRFTVGGKQTNPVLLDLDDLPEQQEDEPNDDAARANRVSVPAVVNGRIDRPGDVDTWAVTARKGEALALELRARQLGSPLQAVLTVSDTAGKVLARAEAAGEGQDPALSFVAGAEGEYLVRVADRFRTRGGPEFAYRLRLAPPAAPGFVLRLPADQRQGPLRTAGDVVTLPRGGQAKVKVLAERHGGFAGPIRLSVEGLPASVTATGTVIAAGQGAADVTLTAGPSAAIGAVRLTVRGTATIGGREVTQGAALPAARGEPETSTLLLAVALKPPFKIVGSYDLRLSPRGTVFRKRYKVERGGYEGPLEVSLADRQARHLQGVTGPTVTVPAGASEFEYAVSLPPWMETGRTSRACVMAVGIIKEGGAEHVVGYSTDAQNEQVIAVVETGRLGLEADRQSVLAVPGGAVPVAVKVSRGKGLAGPVAVELRRPSHVRGLSADPVVIPAGQSRATLTLRFAGEPLGPFNMPLVLRATLNGPTGPVVAETKIEVVRQGGPD